MERTLAILKPDCVRKNLVGKVISHIESAGFKIVAMKMLKLTPEQARAFYYVHRERHFYNDLVNFMSSGKIVALVLEKENAVDDFRKLIGATDPKEAEEGTIRRLYADNKQENIVHGSDSVENAKIEISFFFSQNELIANET
ncbi:nucleoside diphosphate kinase [Candidatus Thermokryptus mobilis]|uniref:Nucleoside diphosphate kinase n=1 Tax=Candidatus Thermokryptus mobilis TaxID=1643428 RepID=A0A0S4NC23_9BACT|nr:nucleoside-diphosphate kinase [Candidatus Thermokryptus mobilis]CUU07702.1 nucleoside diphosphate kinase [Candidatus Thermokryptus mobilis]